MSASDFFRRRKRSGSVLAAVLLLGLCAFSLSALCLASADIMFRDLGVLSEAMERENIARAALEFSKEYFASEISLSSAPDNFSAGPGGSESPVMAVPKSVFNDLSHANADTVIEAAVIDLHYAESFAGEALKQGIAEGRPSRIIVGGDQENGAILFYAARYEIRVKVTLARSPRKSRAMACGILVLTDAETGGIRILPLYTRL